MTPKLLHRLVALPLASALGACAHYSQEDGERLANEVYALSTQLAALQKSLGEVEKSQKLQGERLGETSSQVEAMSAQARRNDADLGAQLDAVREDLARVRGIGDRIENLETKLNQTSDQLTSIEEAKKQAEAARTEAEKAAAAAAAEARERMLGDPEQLVGEVVKLLNQQKIKDARQLLRDFQRRAEGDKGKAKHLDRIQFLLAETYFLEGNYQLAVSEYNKLRKDFPNSDRVPDALLKMGLGFEKLSFPDDAKLFYETLISKYPKAGPTAQAKERLAELKKKK